MNIYCGLWVSGMNPNSISLLATVAGMKEDVWTNNTSTGKYGTRSVLEGPAFPHMLWEIYLEIYGKWPGSGIFKNI